jgi:hypothetical protein
VRFLRRRRQNSESSVNRGVGVRPRGFVPQRRGLAEASSSDLRGVRTPRSRPVDASALDYRGVGAPLRRSAEASASDLQGVGLLRRRRQTSEASASASARRDRKLSTLFNGKE